MHRFRRMSAEIPLRSLVCRSRAAAPLFLATLIIGGCAFKEVREQQQKMDALCTLQGQVRAEAPDNNPLVVVLVRKSAVQGDPARGWYLVDHYVLEGAGRWIFRVTPGTYALAAFKDRNANLVYEPGEPALQVVPERTVTCAPAARIQNLQLVIPENGQAAINGSIDIAHLQIRSLSAQFTVSLGAVTAAGELVSLDDARFGAEHAKQGLWQPFDFLVDAHPGVYFLEPYTRAKTPVLFVHGIAGSPTDFRYLIDHLDRDRFQPWVYYYPSGVHLDAIAAHLDQTIKQLQLRYGFRRLLLVAHSMGGLVSRDFLLRNQTENGRAHIPLFVSISTPWGGVPSAAEGVKRAPTAIRVWHDISPGSAFLRSLFFTDPALMKQHRPLPSGTDYQLLFGFKRDSRSRGESDDQGVSVASQLYPGAQEDATRLYGFDATHEGILESPEVSRLVNRLLAAADR
jgi:pimeloyl-ACP methyl ester carboxylesterase